MRYRGTLPGFKGQSNQPRVKHLAPFRKIFSEEVQLFLNSLPRARVGNYSAQCPVTICHTVNFFRVNSGA